MKTILMTAYDVDPYKGSESATGWNFILQASRFNKVIAVTRKNNRVNIERFIKERDLEVTNIQFLYFDLPYFLMFWKKGARGSSLYFYLWQMCIPFFISSNRLQFDVSHGVNFHADSFPCFLWVLGKPTVWGPINHNEKIPSEFIHSGKEKIADAIKWLVKNVIWVFDPFMFLAKKNTDLIIGGNSSVQKRLRIKDEKFIKLTQAASTPIDDKNLLSAEDYIKNSENAFNILVAGRFLTIKSFDLALLAYDKFYNALTTEQKKRVTLNIVGKGPKEKELLMLKEKLTSTSSINFLGWVEKSEMDYHYKNSAVFFFPSHEGAGMVVIEALSHGLPVICFDNFGAGEFINNDCGIKVPCRGYDLSVVDFSQALTSLFKNKSRRTSMSIASKKLFEKEFTWDVKGEKLKTLYENL